RSTNRHESEPNESATARLQVKQGDLKKRLRLLGKLCRCKPGTDALISYENHSMRIDVENRSLTIPAVGEWPIQARIPGCFLRSFTEMAPAEETIIIRIADGRFYFGSASIGCTWRLPPKVSFGHGLKA